MVELKLYVVAWVSLFDNAQQFAQVEATDELDAISQVPSVAWCVDGATDAEVAMAAAYSGDVVLGVHLVIPM